MLEMVERIEVLGLRGIATPDHVDEHMRQAQGVQGVELPTADVAAFLRLWGELDRA